MEKQQPPQLELFSSSKEGLEIKAKPDNPFLRSVRNYEKTILIIIGVIIVGIISFSLGVEQGKNMVLAKQTIQRKPLPQQAAPQVKTTIAPVVNTAPAVGAFTIQLASYKTRIYALKEADLLKRRGFTPLVLSQGNYTILCVGNFTNKEAAGLLLPQFQRQYSGCRIRRL